MAEPADRSWFMRRTEVRCAACEAHRGQIFPDSVCPDGPKPTAQRFGIAATARKFEPEPGRK